MANRLSWDCRSRTVAPSVARTCHYTPPFVFIRADFFRARYFLPRSQAREHDRQPAFRKKPADAMAESLHYDQTQSLRFFI